MDVAYARVWYLKKTRRARQVGEAEKELSGAGGSNPYAQLVDEAEGLDKIEELQNHTNEDIYDKAVNILETFFDVEDGEVENLAPQVDANQARARPKPSKVLGFFFASKNGFLWHG